ncbi:YceI family protein [Lysobacter sp. A3-1-A15]|uniref:YceI family protein n=1 Tax=Novilysobacter viscosus TaxID=3098602 RepID=UPI002ED80CFF
MSPGISARTPHAVALAALLALLAAWPAGVAAQQALGTLDADQTRIRFELRTRWGQRVMGEFPSFEGEVLALPGEQRQVRIRLRTGAVEVAGSDRYTRVARSEGFFDAARHPWIEFVSDPHPAALVQDGGPLRGRLSMHGVTHEETFQVKPSSCARPGLDCPVVAAGSVDRRRYGLDGYRVALGHQVLFGMQLRLRPAGG